MRARTAVATAAVLWLVLGLAVGSGVGPFADGADEREELTLGRPVILLASLTPFGACDDLLAHVQERALEQVGPWGLDGGPMWAFDDVITLDGEGDGDVADSAGAAVRAGGDEAGGTAGVDFSGTNVQEAGVDEPDIVKTDGRILYTVVDERLRAFDVRGDAPVHLGDLDLPGESWGRELLLDGDRLLVLGTTHEAMGPGPRPIDAGAADDRIGIMPMGSPAATLTLVDVRDPERMAVVESLTLDGAYLSARLVGGVARVVLTAHPVDLPFTFPGGGIRSEERALEANREVIRSSTVDQWLPWYVHTGPDGTSTQGTLLDCDRVHRPGEFSGLGTVSVLSIDPARGLAPREATAVLASGQTIAASTDRLYVATNRWDETTTTTTTEVHAFDITRSDARYVGSGSVPGQLLNQFAMSEHEGVLRVATTEGAAWGRGGTDPQESRVTTLAERDGVLAEIGAVTGLGPDERIYAVRFLGDVAYVVTFRETDPLYTIDLADPTAPEVLGELKIPGYSAYLHPIGEGLVLGVGQDADDEGMRLGAQVSLFDVSDLRDPQRIATLPLAGEGSGTDVEGDHRAFLWWPATRTAIIPVQQWRWDEATGREDVRLEAVGLTAGAEGLAEVGRVSHLLPPAAEPETLRPEHTWEGAIRRSLVVGDRVLTVSGRGVLSSDLATLAPKAYTPLSG